MIYSEKMKLVFIKGRKVAGTSIEIALSKHCAAQDIITPITQVDELLRYQSGGLLAQNYGADIDELKRYHREIKQIADGRSDDANILINALVKPRGQLQNHNPLNKLIKHVGHIPEDFRFFCVARNPYAKMISLANMSGTFRKYKEAGGTLVASDKRISAKIDELLDLPEGPSCHDIQIYKINGVIPARMTIIRYDNLAEEFRLLLQERGIENPSELPHAKAGRRSETLNYRTILTSRQIERINTVFADEFEEFGFDKLAP